MPLRANILILGASARVAPLVSALEEHNHTLRIVSSFSAAASEIDRACPDLMLATESDVDPCTACARTVDLSHRVPVVVVGDDPRLSFAIAAIRARAADFLPGDAPAATIAEVVHRALEKHTLERMLRNLREQRQDEARPFDELLGKCAAMQRVRARLERIQHSDVTVLLVGESGTGKEVAANALHRHGRRSSGPFVAVSCAAIPDHLADGELFGYKRGAFTDANTARRGLLVESSGGTLFLDEVTSASLDVQSKLLRALQQRAVRPLGTAHEVPFDSRIVAAGSADPREEVKAGRFREDLFYRLNVLSINLPPLRERGLDVLLLAQHFLTREAAAREKNVVGFTPAAARELLRHEWPGNVRELANCIRQVVALARYDHITASDVAELGAEPPPDSGTRDIEDPELESLDARERRHILSVLQSVDGNKARAAQLLGIDRTTLYRRLRREAGLANAARG